MNRVAKSILCILLALAACFFAWRFKAGYALLMEDSGSRTQPAEIASGTPTDPDAQAAATPAIRPEHRLGLWGGGLVLSLIALGLFLAHEVTQYFGKKAIDALYDEEAPPTGPDYEKAEDEWNKGNFLEAIELLRAYLKANPREAHVALRIAEIYEKDLQNPLAAALEYEEVLRLKLPPERWGWAAIHLVNLYCGRLGQQDKGVALLRRIDAEFGTTAAAEKARKRLAQLEEEGIIPPTPAAEEGPTPPSGSLPRGFTPRKP